MYNLYGPTEAAVDVTWRRCESGEVVDEVPIGRGIGNTEMYVMDERMEMAGIGIRGEVYIGGVGVGRGYLGRAELTGESFVPEPNREACGRRMYRTGDVGKYLGNGEIEYIGRIDHQVKVRGFRIELGEIEACLRANDGVKEAAAVVRQDVSGESRVIAYVVAEGNPQLDAKDLRRSLTQRLPEYMVPSAFLMLDVLPLTGSGKIDRRALLSLAMPETEQPGAMTARTLAEQWLIAIWRDVLHLDDVGIHDNFFELGGHSLLATRMASRIRAAFGVEFAVQQVFETPTVAGLAWSIEEARRKKLGLLELPIVRAARDSELPLSPAQQRLWFLQELDTHSTAYNIRLALRMRGRLQIRALEESLREVARRHEVLTTTFQNRNGRPIQLIGPRGSPGPGIIDLTGLIKQEQLETERGQSFDEALRPFDLASDVPLRVKLLRLEDDEHVLLLTMHHITSDAWSIGILSGELANLYQAYLSGAPSPLSELPFQYADYAVWQREFLRGDLLQRQIEYWHSRLAGAPVLELPTDRPRLAVFGQSGEEVQFQLSAELTRSLDELSQREGVTVFMTALTAFKIVLGRYASQEDVVVGVPIANRTRREFEDLIGCFVNTLLVRTSWKLESTLAEILRKVREATIGAYANQDLPFDKLSEDLPRASGKESPQLLRAMLVFQNTPFSPMVLPGVSLSLASADTPAPFRTDIDLYMSGTGDNLSGSFVYNPDLFDRETIDGLQRSFEKVLEIMCRRLETRFDQIGVPATATIPPMMRISTGRLEFPLSYHQERIWFIDMFETGVVYPTAPTYHNIPVLVHFKDTVDETLLEDSLDFLIARHDLFQTTVSERSNGLRQVRGQSDGRPLRMERRSELWPAGFNHELASGLALNEAKAPFDLRRDIPVRASLIYIGDGTSILAVVLHHFISDRQTAKSFVRQLGATYRAKKAGLTPEFPEGAINFVDFSDWQRRLSDHQMAPAWQYWRRQLAGTLKALELPLDCARAPVHTFSPGWCCLDLGPVQSLAGESAASIVSRESLLLGTLVLLLHKYTGQDEIVLGTSDQNRQDIETKDALGPFANLLVLRNHVDGTRTASGSLRRIAETLAAARANRLMPFDLLVQRIKPDINMARTALFDVLVDHECLLEDGVSFGDTQGEYVEPNLGYGKYDLNLLLREAAGRLTAIVVYNRDLLDPTTILRLMRHYERLLRVIGSNPNVVLNTVPLLSEAELLQIAEWNDTEAAYPTLSAIHELFDEQVLRTPHSVAVRCGAVSLTYLELNRRANLL
ncbi:MAG: condensation domain-containing protein, partial [Blastocatellia bacterium]